jgi:hypothetical protein
MFSGDERVTVETDLPAGPFEKRLRKALDRLGDVEPGEDGEFAIEPAGDLASFLSRVKLTGLVEETEDGYEVSVRYSLAPSVPCWVAAVVLFTAAFLGAAIVFLPAFEKTAVGDAVRGALRDLKEDVEDRVARPIRAGRRSHADDD